MIRRTALRLTMAAATVASLSYAVPAMAADLTMNVGFGAPEESLYGRFGKIFQAQVEKHSGGNIT